MSRDGFGLVLLASLLCGGATGLETDEDVWAESTGGAQWGRRRTPAPAPVSPSPAPGPSAAGGVEYTFVVTLANKRHSDSSDTISAQLVGSSGQQTDWASLGTVWSSDKMGQPVTLQLQLADVGVPAKLRLQTDGTNAATFASVLVTPAGGAAVFFDTSKQAVRCRTNSWFDEDKPKTKDCDEEYLPSQQGAEPGSVHCTKHKPAEPLTAQFNTPSSNLELQYTGFKVWMDCDRRAAYRFEYNAGNDCGELARRGSFSKDPSVPDDCQQKNGAAYPKTDGISFDRGHLVPANHLDDNKTAIYQSNYMTNILPQAALMNRGAWLQSEEIIECLRVTEDLYVVGGAVFDSSDPRFGWFKESHNVDNPSFFWKVIKASSLHPETDHILALWMPNSETAVRAELDKYVVSIAQLEKNLAKYKQTVVFTGLSDDVKATAPTRAWALPSGCDKKRR